MLFSWQNKRTGDPVKMFKHKKRHEAQYATPADAEVIMKRLGLQSASVHHTESILPASRWNVKNKYKKSQFN
jgi:hypothetical protein